MGIQPVAHRGAGHRREAQIVRQRVGAERGERDAAVGHLVAGVDGAQPVVERQHDIRQHRPSEGEHQRAGRDRVERGGDVLQPEVAELPLHHVDRADQQQHAEQRRQVAQVVLRRPAAGTPGAIRSGGVGGAGERRLDQRDCFGDAIQRDEAAEARPLLLAEQHLIQAAEPGAQFGESMALADLVDDVLDRFGVVPDASAVAMSRPRSVSARSASAARSMSVGWR